MILRDYRQRSELEVLLEVEGLARQLRETGGVVRRVLPQTRARIVHGRLVPGCIASGR